MASGSGKSLREVLHSAYTFVRSVEVNRAVSSITLDHLIQEQISSYKQGSERSLLDGKGTDVGKRISKLDALSNLQTDINNAVKAVRDAGTDAGRLEALGIYEVDEPEAES